MRFPDLPLELAQQIVDLEKARSENLLTDKSGAASPFDQSAGTIVTAAPASTTVVPTSSGATAYTEPGQLTWASAALYWMHRVDLKPSSPTHSRGYKHTTQQQTVPRFLNRILGLPSIWQRLMFDLFTGTVEKHIRQVRALGLPMRIIRFHSILTVVHASIAHLMPYYTMLLNTLYI